MSLLDVPLWKVCLHLISTSLLTPVTHEGWSPSSQVHLSGACLSLAPYKMKFSLSTDLIPFAYKDCHVSLLKTKHNNNKKTTKNILSSYPCPRPLLVSVRSYSDFFSHPRCPEFKFVHPASTSSLSLNSGIPSWCPQSHSLETGLTKLGMCPQML